MGRISVTRNEIIDLLNSKKLSSNQIMLKLNYKGFNDLEVQKAINTMYTNREIFQNNKKQWVLL